MDTEVLDALFLSFRSASLAILIISGPAILTGWVLAKKEFPGKSLVDALVHLPMVLPPVTIGYGLLLVFGKQGPLGSLFYEVFGLRIAFTGIAVVAAAATVSFPLFARSARTAFEMGNPGLSEASRVLGRSRLSTWFAVSLPLAVPGIAAGAVLGFARALGEFGATAAFAGNIPGVSRTLPLAIWTALQTPGGENRAGLLCLLTILPALAAFTLSGQLHRRLGRLHGR